MTLAAEFAPSESTQVTICRQSRNERIIASVIFAAATWHTVVSSTADATEQLASALLYIVPRQQAPELRRMLSDGGISPFRRVLESSRIIPHDSRAHLVIYLTAPGFETPDLARLYDELDMILRREGFGEVDGSGAGLGGYNLDVSLRDRVAGVRSVFEFLRQHRLIDYARVVETDTGQRLSDSIPVA